MIISYTQNKHLSYIYVPLQIPLHVPLYDPLSHPRSKLESKIFCVQTSVIHQKECIASGISGMCDIKSVCGNPEEIFHSEVFPILKLSSPGPKPLAPKHKNPKSQNQEALG